MYRTIILLVLATFVSKASAGIRLPAIIGENMVLQRGIKVPLWGWADPGEIIYIDFQNETFKTQADRAGKWSTRIRSYRAGGPYHMRIRSASSDITFNNILLGDVWVCSGQSNMEFGIQTEKHAQQEIPEASDSLIRMFYVPMAFSKDPKADIVRGQGASRNGKWIVCSPAAMEDTKWAWHGFSAAGYYFAKTLRNSAGSPVGMIGTYKGGTPAQAWISPEGLQKKPAFTNYLNTETATGFSSPSGLFNAMVQPLINYGIKGVIWYQGESNGDKLAQALEYPRLFSRLISDWRHQWSQGNFPFLYVQLASFRKPAQTASEGIWPWVREAQLLTLSVPNTAMVVTTDLGDALDIHPGNKKDIGMRLALAARKVAYKEKLVYSGPVYRSMKVTKDTIVLHFSHIGSGLRSAGPLFTGLEIPKQLKGFGIAAADGRFVWANAVINGSTVKVWSPEIADPVAVRYNWADNPAGTLYNEEGLPATPFRTDHFPKE